MNITMNQNVNAKDIDGFESIGHLMQNIKGLFPKPSGNRIMMMPFYAESVYESLPGFLDEYKPMIKKMLSKTPAHVQWFEGNTAYLTIDEMQVTKGEVQRNPGLHVDGMYKGTLSGAWAGLVVVGDR